MTNRQIAATFKLLSNLLEMYDENSFKIKQYSNAYISLRKIDEPIFSMNENEIRSLPTLGKTIIEKIIELKEKGTIKSLDELLLKTPPGVVDMLKVRGLGPKKVKTIWKELGIEDTGDLLLACNENRLVEAKGFGFKTQESIKTNLEFAMSNSGKYLYAYVHKEADECINHLRSKFVNNNFDLIGDIAMKMPIVEGISIYTDLDEKVIFEELIFEDGEIGHYKNIKINIINANSDNSKHDVFKQTAGKEFYDYFDVTDYNFENEDATFKKKNIPFIPLECREDVYVLNRFMNGTSDLIKNTDIKGVIHTHTKYSDGIHSLSEMAKYCMAKDYQYLVISDHSKSAFYANGLNEDRLISQWNEIDEWNKKNKSNFKIFKSIESDILNDGRLDYEDDILSEFDCVIASIHSNLNMTEEKATSRIIKAIENPFTDILGHPTGRLLLGRKGYPLDMQKVIDACFENDVAIELNANPQRLDLDWIWVRKAIEKGVLVSINPDAHSVGQIDYIEYGILAARKAGLMVNECLNTLDVNGFQKWVNRT
jgi:DNA polymerase (family X)